MSLCRNLKIHAVKVLQHLLVFGMHSEKRVHMLATELHSGGRA